MGWLLENALLVARTRARWATTFHGPTPGQPASWGWVAFVLHFDVDDGTAAKSDWWSFLGGLRPFQRAVIVPFRSYAFQHAYGLCRRLVRTEVLGQFGADKGAHPGSSCMLRVEVDKRIVIVHSLRIILGLLLKRKRERDSLVELLQSRYTKLYQRSLD